MILPIFRRVASSQKSNSEGLIVFVFFFSSFPPRRFPPRNGKMRSEQKNTVSDWFSWLLNAKNEPKRREESVKEIAPSCHHNQICNLNLIIISKQQSFTLLPTETFLLTVRYGLSYPQKCNFFLPGHLVFATTTVNTAASTLRLSLSYNLIFMEKVKKKSMLPGEFPVFSICLFLPFFPSLPWSNGINSPD